MYQEMKHRNKNTGNDMVSNGTNSWHPKPTDPMMKCHECGSSNGLHHFNCLPNYLRFNRFVRTGYRLNLTTWQCLKSLFYFHNESFNIYSHGLPVIFFILLSPYIYGKITTLNKLHLFLYSIHHITCVICVLCSTLYHLMMCHKKGEKVYYQFLGLDMLGIWFVMIFGFIAFIDATFFCFPLLSKVLLSVYSLMACISLVYILKGRSSMERLYPLIPIGCFRALLYASRVYMVWNGYSTGNVDSAGYLVIMELLGLLGSIINTSRLPEKWLDGKLDYLFNSHNIMHIVVLMCPIPLHLATVSDFNWMETATCPV